MNNWTDMAGTFDADQDSPAVLVTVGRAKGSTPRDTGANMLITTTKCVGTIGGGRLEYQAIEKARELLQDENRSSEIHELPLGPELAQCCGGYVELLLHKFRKGETSSIFNRLSNSQKNLALLFHWSEAGCRLQVISEEDSLTYLNKPVQAAIERCLTTSASEIIESDQSSSSVFTLVQSLHDTEFHVTVFGAGHVGRAVITTLSPLPCRIIWVDSRASEFPVDIPKNVQKVVTASEVSAIAGCPVGSYFLVMTHSHQLDLEICDRLLTAKEDAAFIGLIGSKTKKSKFEKRLATRGFDPLVISRITCPIGLPELGGKRPAEIALGIVADILRRHQQAKGLSAPRRWDKVSNSI